MAISESMGELVDDVMSSKVAQDVVEIGKDGGQLVEDIARSPGRYYATGIVLTVAGLAISGYSGYLIGVKRTTLRMEKLMEEESEKTRVFYKRLSKDGEFSTPESAADALLEKADESLEDAADALRTYRGEQETTPVSSVRKDVVEKVVEHEIRSNVFDDSRPTFVWEQEVEERLRAENPDEPYVISFEEFQEGVVGHTQIELTYFREDDTLIDDDDMPVANVDYVVGENNLSRFGEGSRDHNIVYIRNDNTSTDYTVALSTGSYSEEAAGPEPELRHSYSRSRMRRGADE